VPELHKITFEHVKTSELHRYYDADPAFYKNARPVVSVDDVAEEHWEKLERIDSKASIQEQQTGLQQLIERGDLIRNVRVYKATVADVEWEECGA
jgi:hypothetical protein